MIDDHLYSAILRSLEQTHCARLWFYMSDLLLKGLWIVRTWATISTYQGKQVGPWIVRTWAMISTYQDKQVGPWAVRTWATISAYQDR